MQLRPDGGNTPFQRGFQGVASRCGNRPVAGSVNDVVRELVAWAEFDAVTGDHVKTRAQAELTEELMR